MLIESVHKVYHRVFEIMDSIVAQRRLQRSLTASMKTTKACSIVAAFTSIKQKALKWQVLRLRPQKDLPARPQPNHLRPQRFG